MGTPLFPQGFRKNRLSEESIKTLQSLKTPQSITVLISSACPYCSQMVDLVKLVASASPLIAASIFNVELYPEVVQRYQPKAAPTTILGDEIFLTGQVSEKELVGWLMKLDAEDYLDELYRNDLLEKRLESAIKRLQVHPHHLSILADLLKAEEFGIKLGAMAAFEQLAEEASQLQGLMLESLLPLLQNESVQVVGDTAYLIGLLQDERKTAVLTPLLSHPNPEIVEAAREGLAYS
jgi:hypothetical protein